MLFQHVAIAGLAHIDAPRRLSSAEINLRLKPTLDRLGIKTDVLQDIAGIHARHLWDEGMLASDAATLALESLPGPDCSATRAAGTRGLSRMPGDLTTLAVRMRCAQ